MVLEEFHGKELLSNSSCTLLEGKPRSMKFIHCSDLHIDSPLQGLERYEGAPVDAMRSAPRGALKNIVEIAIDNAVDLVVMAGDIFDGDWRDYNTAKKIPVVLIRGNHDAASEITKALRLPENVTTLSTRKAETKRFDAISVAVHGQSFAERAVMEDIAAGYPKAVNGFFNLGVLHTSLAGNPDHDPYAPTTLDVLKSKGYDYWALGHIHARQILSESSPRIVYCGNSQGRHARELGAKGCELITYDGKSLNSEFIATDVVRWVRLELDITGLADLAALLDVARKELLAEIERAEGRTLAVRVALRGRGKVHSALTAAPDAAIADIRNMAIECSNGNAWIEKVQRETLPAYDRKALEIRDDPIGELARLVKQLEESPGELQAAMQEEIRPLLERVPAEIRDSLSLNDPVNLAAALRDAESMLMTRLQRAK